VPDHGLTRGALKVGVQYGLTGIWWLFYRVVVFGFRLQVALTCEGKDSGGGKHTFVEVSLRSGMVLETHCKFRDPWRRSGGGSFGFFCQSREAWSRET